MFHLTIDWSPTIDTMDLKFLQLNFFVRGFSRPLQLWRLCPSLHCVLTSCPSLYCVGHKAWSWTWPPVHTPLLPWLALHKPVKSFGERAWKASEEEQLTKSQKFPQKLLLTRTSHLSLYLFKDTWMRCGKCKKDNENDYRRIDFNAKVVCKKMPLVVQVFHWNRWITKLAPTILLKRITVRMITIFWPDSGSRQIRSPARYLVGEYVYL